MSRFVDVNARDAIDGKGAVQALEKMGTRDEGFLQAAADVLLGLSLNPDLLKDAVRAELNEARQDKTVFYSPQSFLIALGRFADGVAFTLRGNLWFPRNLDPENQSLEDYVYSYDNCHDHNFDFLTVGYIGPGYMTDLYQYDPTTVTGHVGELVDLTSNGEVQLRPGTILHFRKSVDVHVQKHPKALSVSINLLIADPEVHQRAQYEFDAVAGAIAKTIYSSSMHYASFSFLAGEFGSKVAAKLALERLKGSPMWQLRHACGRAALCNALASAESLDELLDLPGGVSVAREIQY